jgi:hypothetical protein
LRLMDDIAATAAIVASGAVKDGERSPSLGIFLDLDRRMRLCPRFLLDEHVVRSTIELSLGRPTVFREAMRHIHLPYERLWVEWSEKHRERLRQDVQDYTPDPLKPVPDRIGFLIEGSGRRGNITWAWQNPPLKAMPNPPNVSPFDVQFDLDAQIPQEFGLLEGLKNATLGELWRDSPVQLEALCDIWRTARHVPSAWGSRWLSHYGKDAERFFLSDIYGELIGVYATLLLLTASRPTVEYKQVSQAKINKARIKKRVAPLFDHTEVSMRLSHRTVQQRQGQPLGHARKSPRVHVVSSYLVVHNGRHSIVQPYIRGSGDAIERHIKVTK